MFVIHMEHWNFQNFECQPENWSQRKTEKVSLDDPVPLDEIPLSIFCVSFL